MAIPGNNGVNCKITETTRTGKNDYGHGSVLAKLASDLVLNSKSWAG